MQERIRPIYSELQGLLSQIPTDRNYIREPNIWGHLNNLIGELIKVSGRQDFARFQVEPVRSSTPNGTYVHGMEYRTKISGLISRLHGEYFQNDPAPFSGTPATNITQISNQHQAMSVQILLDIQSKIDKNLNETKDTTEKTFLETVKQKLATVGNVAQLITLILETANNLGLSVDKLYHLFK